MVKKKKRETWSKSSSVCSLEEAGALLGRWILRAFPVIPNYSMHFRVPVHGILPSEDLPYYLVTDTSCTLLEIWFLLLSLDSWSSFLKTQCCSGIQILGRWVNCLATFVQWAHSSFLPSCRRCLEGLSQGTPVECETLALFLLYVAISDCCFGSWVERLNEVDQGFIKN